MAGQPAANAMLARGSRFATFVIQGMIGRGGMGVVYRASDERIGRDIALKLIAPELTRVPGFRARFEQEWRLAAQIEHPHVVPIYAVGEEGGQLYIAMRFVPGSDLAAILDDGRLEPERAVQVVEHVASALGAAHRQGLVHRDVKPGNVLVSGRDAFLTDFGLTVERDAQHPFPRNGGIVGTAAYMAPEQIRGGDVGPPADVYALGGVLCHCLTGRRPFAAERDLDALDAHLWSEPPRPSAVVAGVPSQFDDVVATAMAKDPTQRFSTTEELAAAAAGALRAGRSSSPGRKRLPAQRRSLVGRDEDIETLRGLLEDSAASVVTVTGAGGSGKTQLALAAARAAAACFPDGTFFVALEDVRDVAAVPGAVAQAVGLFEPGSEPTIDWLADRLAERRLLLVLDNFEHLLAAAKDVAALADTPGLRLLVTSQTPLRVEGEHVHVLEGLPLPDQGVTHLDALRASPAVALLAERVTSAGGRLEVTSESSAAIAGICRLLDGLPLALELAASRLTLLDPDTLLAELEAGLAALGSGRNDAAPRQRGMLAALDWTCSLLSDRERALLADLSVFAGGFTVALTEAVEGENVIDGLAALHDHSLLRREASARLVMPPPVRAHAARLLEESGRLDAVRRQHAMALLELTDPVEFAWMRDPLGFRAVLDPEQDNLRAAFTWARHHDPEVHARLVASTCHWVFAGPSHAWHLAELKAATAFSAQAEPRLHARVCLAWTAYAITVAQPHLGDAAVRAWQELGEAPGLTMALCGRSDAHALAGDAAAAMHDALAAREVCRRANEPWLADMAELTYSQALVASGDATGALEVVDRIVKPGGTEWASRGAVSRRADALMGVGRPAEAIADYLAYMDGAPELDVAMQLDGIAVCLAALGRHRDALMVAAVTERLRRTLFFTAPPLLRSELEAGLAPARHNLPDEAQAECRAEIEAMPLDEALEWAERTALEAAAAGG